MGQRLVTVVVPTYGRPMQIRACLTALASQTLRDAWEVVVVDDGSPQPVEGFLSDSFAAQLDLRIVRQDNLGPSAARNRGVDESRGTFIAFTDDDCCPQPDWLERLASAAAARPEALIGGTTTNGLPGKLFSSASQLIIDLVYEHFNANPDRCHFFASNNMMCSRRRFLELGGFDESFRRAGAEDRDFCDRWRTKGWPLVWQPSARVEHRHLQTVGKFLSLHFRYGRGAYIYQSKRRLMRSSTMRQDLHFHRTLVRRIRGRLPSHDAAAYGYRLYAALLAWQVANAAGFATEAAASAAARLLHRWRGSVR